MIYLNNAATSWPKPPQVLEAVTAVLASEPVSPLRSNVGAGPGSAGGPPASVGAGPVPAQSNIRGNAADLLTELRQLLGRLFHISDWERIFFCSSATDATNRIIDGLPWAGVGYAIGSHNSVLRPLANKLIAADGSGQAAADGGGQIQEYVPTSGTGGGYYGLFLNHCSNVTGEIHDPTFADWHGGRPHTKTLRILDAAQSAGCIPIDVDGWGVDILIFTGHKGLFGPMGTGGYYVRRGIDLRPAQFGGTGRDSSIIRYGIHYATDWEYEVGTQNIPGLAGLKAGVEYVLSRGVENIFKKEQELTLWFIDALRAIPNVALYTSAESGCTQGPVVSFNIGGLLPSDVGYILQNSYGITVRTGLHCAPLIHQRLGTAPHGTVRVSLSDFNTRSDLEALVAAVGDIARSISYKACKWELQGM